MIAVWNIDAPRFRNKEKQVYLPWKGAKGKTFDRYYYLYDQYELKHQLKSVGFKIVKQIKDKENIILVLFGHT